MNVKRNNLQKYTNKNPIQKFLLDRFFDRITFELSLISFDRVLEFGCGEGYFLAEMRKRSAYFQPQSFLGVDIRKEAITYASELNPGYKFLQRNILAHPLTSFRPDLVIASEVLEHIPSPAFCLTQLKQLESRYFLLTVPWEPWFRLLNFLRGRDVSRLGNHPEHVNTWTHKGFIRFISRHLKILHATTSFPFTIVIASQNYPVSRSSHT